MNLIRLLTTVAVGPLLVNEYVEREMNNPRIELLKPVDTVSIIIPCYNEEKFIEGTLKSLKAQTIIQAYPEYFEIILANNNSTDNSVKLAEPYVDRILNVTQKGKLYARNQAIDAAKGNIIVAGDADIYYPPHSLNTLLAPFNDPTISGVIGSFVTPNIPGIPLFLNRLSYVVDKIILHPTQMLGCNSAFWKHKFYQVGKFDTTINQMHMPSMVEEEERKFGQKLSKLGSVRLVLGASCIHLGGEKIECRWKNPSSKSNCQKYGIGIQRFG